MTNATNATTTPNTTPNHIARIYVTHNSPDSVAVQFPGTKYELHLKPNAPVSPSPQGRAYGTIRLNVWKLDLVSAGGTYVEPLAGRPRRAQGKVLGSIPGSNGIIVEVCGQPLVADLPPRYIAANYQPLTKVALDIHEGATFDPAPIPAAP